LASNIRRSKRTFSQRFLAAENQVTALARNPSPRTIGARTITSDMIAPGAIDGRNLTVGLNDSLAFIQASANGKNTIYRQPTEPSGGNYRTGDIWFDTDNDNRFSRYKEDPNTPGWFPFTLGDNALGSISANKITAGTIDASVITVSNLDAGNITTGTLTGRTLSGNTIIGGTITIGSGTTIFKADTNGIYLGNSTFDSAPFRVTPAGSMTATQGSIAGWLLTSTEFQSGAAYINSNGSALLPNIIAYTVGGYGAAMHTGGSTDIGLKTLAGGSKIGYVRNISYGAVKPDLANRTVGDIHFS
jgi:hypothetical protein